MEVDSAAVAAEAPEASNNGSGTSSKDGVASSSAAPAPAGRLPASDRLLFCAEVLIGYKCEVQVRQEGSRQEARNNTASATAAAPVRFVGGWGSPARSAPRLPAAAAADKTLAPHSSCTLLPAAHSSCSS